jgi:hypothetical protein
VSASEDIVTEGCDRRGADRGAALAMAGVACRQRNHVGKGVKEGKA